MLTQALPVFLLGITTLACFLAEIEFVCYLLMPRWYFRLGSPSQRDEWQTRASVERVIEAIRKAFSNETLLGRWRRDGFCIRQPLKVRTCFARVWLAVHDSPLGAVVQVEVRSIYPIATPLLVFCGLTFLMCCTLVRVFDLFPYALPLFALCVLVMNPPRAVKSLNRLPTIRAALAPFGLRVCEHCGYDLFAIDPAAACPECGRDAGSVGGPT